MLGNFIEAIEEVIEVDALEGVELLIEHALLEVLANDLCLCEVELLFFFEGFQGVFGL